MTSRGVRGAITLGANTKEEIKSATIELLNEMLQKNEIATQYIDGCGNPSASIPFNPNGSLHAIEGITSPDGLVLGKMGHTERFGDNVGKNIIGNKIQPLFTAGVKYFK